MHGSGSQARVGGADGFTPRAGLLLSSGMRSLLPLGLLFLITGCIARGPGVAAAQYAAPPTGDYAVDLPLERSHWIVAEASIAGRTVRLVVDTGAANSLLSPALARSLALPQVGTVPVVDFENRRKQLPVVTAGLTLGGALFRDVGFVVADTTELSAAACQPIDGLLGQNVLYQTTYEIDIHGLRLRLASGPEQLPPREGGQQLRLAPPSYLAHLRAPARGLMPRFMTIDTGSPYALTAEDAVMRVLPIADSVRAPTMMSGLHGKARVREETLFAWPDVPVGGLDLRGVDAKGGRGSTTLGLQVLDSYVVRVDPRRFTLQLWPTGAPLPRGHAVLGLGFDVADKSWSVTRVVPRSPAERAGLAIGDVVLAIDGVALADMSAQDRCLLGRDFAARPQVRLTVVHAGQSREVELVRAPIFQVAALAGPPLPA